MKEETGKRKLTHKMAPKQQSLLFELGTCHRFMLCALFAYQSQLLLSMVSPDREIIRQLVSSM